MTWHSVHVHHHQDDQDDLVLDAVRPLFAEVAPQVQAAYLVRHWRRGPHLRLSFATTADVFDRVVRPAVDRHVVDHLTRHPSTAALDPVALLPLHERLAELEDDPGPLLPWLPDGSVTPAPHDSRAEALGAAAAGLLTEFYATTTDLLFDQTDRVRAGAASRSGVGFDLMVATAQACSRNGIGRAALSFRSHAEAFLSTTAGGPAVRVAWDAHHRAHAGRLVDRVRLIVEAIDHHDDPPPEVVRWTDLLLPLHAKALALIESGELSMPFATMADRVPGPHAAPAPLAELSPFHRAVESDERAWRELRESSWFGAYRLLLNFTYLQMTRLGIKPAARFRLCHLAANAVDEVSGVSTAVPADR